MLTFPATQLSVVERLRSGNEDVRRTAFGDLAEGYWRPSYHYLRLHFRLSPEVAEDLVQAFFTTAFEKQYLERYDPAKARFRTFLRTCLDRFAHKQHQAGRALKRGGGAATLSLDFPGAEQEVAALASTALDDLDRFFRDETIRALFARTVDAMRQAYAREGREIVFAVFERHDLRPASDRSYATVAADLGITTSRVTNYLHGARKRFREMALASLRALTGSDEEYRAEARELFGVEIPR